MNFFKLVMIVLLKIYATSKVFDKICLNAIRDTFFSICGPWSGEGKGTGGDIQQKGESSNFWSLDSLPQFPPLVWHPNLSIKKVLKIALSAYCNDFEKSEWEYFLWVRLSGELRWVES